MDSRSRAKATPRDRVALLMVTAIVVIAVGWGAWLVWNFASGALEARAAAKNASAAAAVGNTAELVSATAQMQAAAEKIHSASWSMPVRVASNVPYLGRSISDAQQFSNAGLSAARAANQVAPAYRENIYQDQTVNLDTLDALLAQLPQASQNLQEAIVALQQVEGDGVGGGTISKYRDDGLAGAASLEVAATQLAPNRSAVLDAMGANGPRSYLVPLLNNAQLRASGGAPLSAAVITVDEGKISVPFNGYINGKAYKGHPAIQYDAASPLACGSQGCEEVPLWGEPAGGLSFVNSSAHPDWRLAGEDLMRSWNASQDRQVQGVLALDTKAIESVLRVVGPVQTSAYGTVDADTFNDRILESAYEDFADRQDERQDVNDEIGQAVIAKMLSGDAATLGATVSALVQDAQGRNFQARFANPTLQEAAQTLGMAGAVRTAQGFDSVSVYSRNRNQSKVDVYSQRQLQVDVELSADGSATVRQILDVENEAQERGSNPDQIGYLTGWSANDWFVVLPPGASNGAISAPNDYTSVTTHPDGLGREVLATTGRIAPESSAQLVISYDLPAGTFSDGSTGVLYQTELNPQPLQNPIQTTVSVRMVPDAVCEASPDFSVSGDTATWSAPMSDSQTLWIRCS